MTHDEIRAAILSILGDIAPEADLGQLKPQVPLRDQLDLDSMDVLNFTIAIHKRLGVEIPETDAARVASLEGAVTYVAASLEHRQRGRD